MRKIILIVTISLLSVISFSQETIDVSVQGISDGVKNSKQQDRDEAILDAKLKAIERAGVSIEATTTMENFKLKKDWVESKAKAVILPGFQIIDIGYGADGLYHVVLTGKVSAREDIGDTEGDKKFRMAKLLLEENRNKALKMMQEVVDNYGDCSAADDALYYLIIESPYNYSSAKERLLKLKVYYPDSPYISQVESYIERESKRPIESFKFVLIPGGSFMMGSNNSYSDEKPIHKVNIQPFYMMSTEVTQAMWKVVIDDNPSRFKGDNLPIENVSWNDCQEFIKKLNQFDPGKGYRLPTEAEWEYACCGGTTTRYYSGDSESDLKSVGWWKGNSDGKTHPVGQKEPNAWGLYDMHGNVWEWCEDWYQYSYNGASSDGSAWLFPSGSARVLRGGGWDSNPDNCRSVLRYRYAPSGRNNNIGFRLVFSP